MVIVVGPAGTSTREYISQAKVMADQARAEGMRVTEIYTPHATWPRVKEQAQHANLLVYFGHGNGFPSRYGPDLHEDSQDGFGLNRVDGGSYTSDVKYWGAKFVRSAIHLAAHAVVVLYRLCYASGNAESDRDAPELPSRPADVKVAIQRVDNFASGFLAAGAGVCLRVGLAAEDQPAAPAGRHQADDGQDLRGQGQQDRAHRTRSSASTTTGSRRGGPAAPCCTWTRTPCTATFARSPATWT